MRSTRPGKTCTGSRGLDLLGAYGLKLVFVPHWNNAEGGAELDTSRCFMGRQRLEQLGGCCPLDGPLGIDEHTALIFDFQQGRALVAGKGTITIASDAGEKTYSTGDLFALDELGPYRLPPDVVASRLPARAHAKRPPATPATLPPEVAQRSACAKTPGGPSTGPRPTLFASK